MYLNNIQTFNNSTFLLNIPRVYHGRFCTNMTGRYIVLVVRTYIYCADWLVWYTPTFLTPNIIHFMKLAVCRYVARDIQLTHVCFIISNQPSDRTIHSYAYNYN